MNANVFRGKVAVITGAGGGVGHAFAIELAGTGARLALSDAIVAGAARGRRRTLVGSNARIFDWLARVFPVHDGAAMRLFKGW